MIHFVEKSKAGAWKLFVSLLAFISFIACKSKKEDDRPNIIFLLADDLGYGDVGFSGQEQILTPHADQLAREGKIFTNCYAGAPVSGPSRSVLMTGQHTGHTTVRGNITMKGGTAGLKGTDTVYRANLLDTDITIGNIMQEAGYKTCLIGKWHLGGFDSTATPLYHGFDEFSGWLINKPQTYSNTYWPVKRMKNNVMVDIPENAGGKHGYYHTDMCTDEAIDYITRNKDSEGPFMLMLCYSNPHAPLDAPDHAVFNDKDWPDDMKTYASMIYHLDKSVERIKQAVIELGLAENTIIFFCSDNGPRSNYSQQLTDVVDFFDSNGKLRGYKRDIYEGGIRTPMVAWSPGLIKPGTVSDYPWYFADIMPTFAEIAHSTAEMKTDGMSICPAIFTDNDPDTTRYLYWEFFERGFKQAVRYGKWKFVKINGIAELYDLSVDEGEQNDIAGQHPDIIQNIEEYLAGCRTDSPYWVVNPEDADRP